jgi:hypothetical protein
MQKKYLVFDFRQSFLYATSTLQFNTSTVPLSKIRLILPVSGGLKSIMMMMALYLPGEVTANKETG